jgi:hypothetical protein
MDSRNGGARGKINLLIDAFAFSIPRAECWKSADRWEFITGTARTIQLGREMATAPA